MIRFSVLGQPHPKGSKRAFVRGKRAIVTEQTGKGLATWRPRLVATVAEHAPADGPLPEPVAVLARFRLAPPRKRRWPWPVAMNRGDLDKLARTLLDELSSIVIADDSQVVLLACTKVYDERPGCDVAVVPLMPIVDAEFSASAALDLRDDLEGLVVELQNHAPEFQTPIGKEVSV